VNADAVLEVDAEREGARPDLHAGRARGGGVLLAVATTHAAAAMPAVAALRVEAPHPEADLGRQIDHVLRRQVDDVLDLAAAARAAAERLEQLLVDVIGDGAVGGGVSRLAARPAGLRLAPAAAERRGLPLRRTTRLLQLGLEPIDLAALAEYLALGAPQPGRELVALGAQRIALGDDRREHRVEDCADAEVVGHGRMTILFAIRTTFCAPTTRREASRSLTRARPGHEGR
jgi:hypothetical protein